MNTDRRFLNYKEYDNFQRDLNDGKISEDSIVFIQDVLRIWARGKEYVCSGLTGSIAPTEDGVGSVITLQDALGNSRTATVTNKSTVDLLTQTVEGIHTTVQSLSSNVNELSTTIDDIQESVNDLSTFGSSVRNNMVTLSTRAYQLLVDANAVDPDTYYFTYEGDDIQSWTFGDTFPITFGSESAGTFPITLT